MRCLYNLFTLLVTVMTKALRQLLPSVWWVVIIGSKFLYHCWWLVTGGGDTNLPSEAAEHAESGRRLQPMSWTLKSCVYTSCTSGNAFRQVFCLALCWCIWLLCIWSTKDSVAIVLFDNLLSSICQEWNWCCFGMQSSNHIIHLADCMPLMLL